jgi:hypothetical protein
MALTSLFRKSDAALRKKIKRLPASRKIQEKKEKFFERDIVKPFAFMV